jgi:hypothetical protein
MIFALSHKHLKDTIYTIDGRTVSHNDTALERVDLKVTSEKMATRSCWYFRKFIEKSNQLSGLNYASNPINLHKYS